ncbi:hypothetical protein A4A49_56785, partial [Nicotiana attenuata]
KDNKISCSSQREVNLTDLPFDIIINILNRLPFKSLFQTCLICKSWRSLLSTPKITTRINVICDKLYPLLSNSDVSCPSNVIWKFKIPIELHSLDYMLLKPVNGILCICGPLLSHVSYVYLWNPLTKEFKSLPKPSIHLGYVADNFGFGYIVPNTNYYKVVRVLRHERKHDARIEIYSLNHNSWKRVRDSCSNRLDTFPSGDLTVDLEKEVITEVDSRYVKHCGAITWINERDAILLTYPEDDLVLCHSSYGQTYSYRSNLGSSTKFAFVRAL